MSYAGCTHTITHLLNEACNGINFKAEQGLASQVAVKGTLESKVFVTKAEAISWAAKRETEIREGAATGSSEAGHWMTHSAGMRKRSLSTSEVSAERCYALPPLVV